MITTILLVWYAMFWCLLSCKGKEGEIKVKDVGWSILISCPADWVVLLLLAPPYILDVHRDTVLWRKK